MIASLRAVLLLCLLGSGAASPAVASGSGSGGQRDFPPQDYEREREHFENRQPPIDRPAYTLGQKIFDGRVSTPGAAKPEEQRPVLQVLQGRLPRRVAKKKDLVAHAGNLTPAQLSALVYYVNQRYHSR